MGRKLDKAGELITSRLNYENSRRTQLLEHMSLTPSLEVIKLLERIEGIITGLMSARDIVNKIRETNYADPS